MMRAALRLILAAPLLAMAVATPAALPVQRVEVVRAYPHDPGAFTQGLFWRDGSLIETTGLNGESSLRQVRLADGKVLRRRDLPASVFGEGAVDWGGRLITIEWQSGRGSVWRLSDFAPLSRFSYPGEGWGLTRDPTRIIMSDGTPQLRFLDPATLKETGPRVTVRAEGRPVYNLNELEYVDGEVWANVWMTDIIARIDPKTGGVKGWIDATGLLPTAERRPTTDVLNGIAWDARGRRLFLTGKKWPKLYEVRLVPPAR